MKLPVYKVNAFAKKYCQGNPAGVCPLEEWIDDDLMQAVAKENGYSETAFFVKNGDEFDLRWFTPGCEVDLCGHGTLGTACVIANELGYYKDRMVFNTKSGKLIVAKRDDLFILDFPALPAKPAEAPPNLIEGLGAEPVEILKAEDYLLIFKDEETIRNMKPDFKAVMNIDIRGTIVSAPASTPGIDFVSRWFGSAMTGIEEDPATGSAHCTLAPYWAEKMNKNQFKALQLSERGAEISCEVAGDRVKIGGNGVLYFRGEVFV